jgi:ribosomal protein L4
MPKIDLFDRTGATVGSVDLSDELFAAPVNAAVLHQVVTAQLAGRRTGAVARAFAAGALRARVALRRPVLEDWPRAVR